MISTTSMNSRRSTEISGPNGKLTKLEPSSPEVSFIPGQGLRVGFRINVHAKAKMQVRVDATKRTITIRAGGTCRGQPRASGVQFPECIIKGTESLASGKWNVVVQDLEGKKMLQDTVIAQRVKFSIDEVEGQLQSKENPFIRSY
jgi:hypothetical protein